MQFNKKRVKVHATAALCNKTFKMEEIVVSEGDVPGAHFSRDPAEYSVLELKRWSECHGCPGLELTNQLA